MLVTGLVGRFGVAALAGYGIGVRLEFMLVPIAFGIGSGLTTLVGVAAGANDWQRAVRAAWIGGLTAFAAIGAVGWILAFVPEGWARLFTSDPKVVEATRRLHHARGAVLLPVRARHDACLREPGCGPHEGAVRRRHRPHDRRHDRRLVRRREVLGWGLHGVFVAIAVGMVVFGGLIGGTAALAPWGPRQPRFK